MPLAQEDAETTYFNESVDTAKGAVAEAFDAYEAVLKKLAEGERAKLQRAMGLKMEQLKVQATQPLLNYLAQCRPSASAWQHACTHETELDLH